MLVLILMNHIIFFHLEALLKKESVILEHLEAKLPPPKNVTPDLAKEPVFTQWVSRLFALLLYFEYLYGMEHDVFSRLKSSNRAKIKINKKIAQVMRERSELLMIMQEKYALIGKPEMDGKFKKEVRHLTAAAIS